MLQGFAAVNKRLSNRGVLTGPGPGIVFIYTYFHLPPLQHLLAAVHAALIPCCRCRAAYHFFIIGQKTFMQCYTVALHKRLVSASVHAGEVANLYV